MNKSSVNTLQYYLIILLVAAFPYRITMAFFAIVSFLILLIGLPWKRINLMELLLNKSIVFGFLFIFMIYLSSLWTPSAGGFFGDFKVTFYGYVNYIFLVPAIYFSKLSKKQIENIFLIIAASPFLYISIYYLNFLQITHIYALGSDFIGKHMFADLFGNLFILFSSIVIYIKLINNILIDRSYKSFCLFILFCFVSGGLFIDNDANSRLIILGWLMGIFTITFLVLTYRLKIFFLLFFVLLSSIYLLNSKTFQNGINEACNSYKLNTYEGSWGHRIKLAQYGLNMWYENILIGRGTSDVTEKMREEKKLHPSDFNDPTVHFHNQHILILVQVGLVGYILFILFIFYSFSYKILNLELYLLKQSSIVIYLFLMLGEHYLQMVNTSTFFALILSLFLLYQKRELEN